MGRRFKKKKLKRKPWWVEVKLTTRKWWVDSRERFCNLFEQKDFHTMDGYDPTVPRDINRLPTDGYLIFPLSMSRLQTAQSPEACYEALTYFDKKIQVFGVDAVFLYTNDLYHNAEETAISVRSRTLSQMVGHKNALMKLIVKEQSYAPQAMHFLPWDYVTLNSPHFETFMHTLRKQQAIHPEFQHAIERDLGDREATAANVNFLLEEIAVTHLLRENMVELPKTLVRRDTFRLMCYHGAYLLSDAYQWQTRLLPLNEECVNPYRTTDYDLEKHVAYDISTVKVMEKSATARPEALRRGGAKEGLLPQPAAVEAKRKSQRTGREE